MEVSKNITEIAHREQPFAARRPIVHCEMASLPDRVKAFDPANFAWAISGPDLGPVACASAAIGRGGRADLASQHEPVFREPIPPFDALEHRPFAARPVARRLCLTVALARRKVSTNERGKSDD
jgi:hypothetical protein